MVTPFLELDNLGRRYGDVAAVEGVSLRIERNEFVTLLGPSGCGKTTILRMIAGFVPPTSGEIRMEGAVISSVTRSLAPEKRELGMVFQNYAVWPHMTVRRNIELPLKLRGVRGAGARSRVEQVLSLCRLSGLADREPHQLSGGQLQRVALARALVYRPRLVLLDEPLSNLDVALREELRRELHRIHRATQATFVLVTHDQVEAMSLSDRVVVMRGGRIQQVGAPQEIYRHPRTEFVASFVGSANLLEGRVAADGIVEAAGLVLRVSRCRGTPAGTAVKLAIHPEAVRVGEPGPQSFAGVVKEAYFLGRTEEISVTLGAIEVRAMQVRGRSFAAGEAVSVSIAEDAVIPLTETTPDA